MEIIELKNASIKIKISLYMKNKCSIAEQSDRRKINKFNNQPIKITQSEQRKKIDLKVKNDQSFRDMQTRKEM